MATGTIEQLNFEILLHDDKFNAQIAKDKEAAKQLNITLSQYLTAKKKEAAVIAQVEKARLQHEKTLRAENTQYQTQSKLLSQLTALAGTYFSVRGAERFLRSLVDITGEFEKQKMSLTSMLQSSEAADRIFNEYRQLALKSPYTFQDFTKFGKQLLAFNIPQEELVGTTKMLADVAAGLGVDMGRIILAYGQIKSAGVLKGTELRQLTEAGVPILDSLAKQIEETTGKAVKLGDVFAMISKKQIPFEMVEEAFRRMTSEGGKFYNMQEVLVETLWGKIGKLRDVWQQTLYDLGRSEGVNNALKGSIDFVTNLISDYEKLGQTIADVVVGFSAYKIALIGVEAATGTFEVANHKLLASLKNILTWVGKNPYAILAAAAAAIGVAAVRSIREYQRSANAMRDAQRAQKEAFDETTISITKEREELKRLNGIASDEKRSMTERKTAIDVINAQYGEYLQNLGIEKVSVDNLKTSYDLLTDAIANKYLQQLRESTVGNAETAMNDARSALNSFNANFIRNTKITSGKNTGKVYNPKGVGLIQGEVEKYIADHPLFDADALYNGLVGIYSKYGLNVKSNAYKDGDLYKLAYDYSQAAKTFRQSESDFDAFVKGYSKSMSDFIKTEQKVEKVTPNAGNGTTNVKENERIASLRNEISQIEKYRKAYNDFVERVGEEMAKEELQKAFKMTFTDFDFDKQLDDKLKALSEVSDKGAEAADSIAASLGRDEASKAVKRLDEEKKAAEKAQNALDKYLETMQKWADADKSREGTGAAYKLSKAIADYHTATAAADRLYNKAMGEADKAGKKNAVELSKAAFLMARDKAGALATLKNTVSGLVDDIFKEGMQGFDLTNWNDKTLQQILEIRDAIKGLDIPDNMKKELSEIDGLLEIAIAAFQKYKQEVLGQTVDPEAEKKFVSAFEKVASYLSRAASSMKELAIASGNTELEDLANATGMVAQNLNAAAAGYQMTGSWIGAVIGGGLDLIEQTVTAIAKAKTEARQIRDEIRDIQREAAMSKAQSLFGSSVFGEGYNPEAVIGKLTELEKSIQKTNSGYLFRTKKGGLFSAEETKSIARFAAEAKMDLWDEYGNLNAELISHILSTYKETLTEEQTNWLKDAQSYSEQYMAIMDGIKDKVESIFGDIADSAAERIVDQWVNAGNAALDYADILDDVARSYAKMLIKSAILDDVLNKEEADKVVEMFKGGAYEDAMSTIADDMQRIADMQPIYEQILQAFDPYFNKEAGDDTLANGINKQLVETNSSLIASYINAMRADLSAQRQDVSVIRDDVNAILGGIGIIPTLNDYLAQVAADAHDTALSNRQILTELQSVITSGSGRRAFAVDVQ